MKFTDVKFEKGADGIYDLVIGQDGDFEKVNSFDTAIQLSLIGSNRRASATEMPEAERREGWIGDIGKVVELGSKIWLLRQARLTTPTLNKLRVYLEQALEWLVDFEYLEQVIVDQPVPNYTEGSVSVRIQLIRFDSKVEFRNFILWDNTGQ